MSAEEVLAERVLRFARTGNAEDRASLVRRGREAPRETLSILEQTLRVLTPSRARCGRLAALLAELGGES